MYITHTVRNKKHFPKMFAALIFLFLLLVALTEALNFLPYPIFRHLAVFAYVIGVAYYIIRFVLTTFTYQLIDRQFVVTKSLSGNDIPLVDISAEQMISLHPAGEKREKGRTDNLTVHLFAKNHFILCYKEGNQLRKVKIEYDEQMIQGLLRLLEQK